jgi:arabinose-5-phosphate isomerase
MVCKPITIQADRLAAEILNILERHPVDELIVLDETRTPVGIVDSQDLSRLHIL